MDEALFEEPHLRLGRVHVHVHALRRHLDEQVHLWAALLHRGHGVRGLDGVRDGLVADDAAIDVDVLRPTAWPLLGEWCDIPVDAHAATFATHFDQVRTSLIDLVEALGDVAGRRAVEQFAAAARELESDGGRTERELRHEARHLRGFGRIRLQELAARRQVVEEVPDLDRRTLWRADVVRVTQFAPIDAQFDACQRTTRAGAEHEMRDGGDARQGFSAETERADAVEVRRDADLAGGVAMHGESCILGRHALAVVLDTNQCPPALLDGHGDSACACIECILDEFLDNRSGPLDHLTGRDLVGERGRQDLDLHVRSSPDA